MDLLQLATVTALCSMTALIANMSASIFHDGLRPILPQVAQGNMQRKEAGSIAFGLSIGFTVSVGLSFTLSTGLLNPWLLFLPTDVLGVLISSRWLAALAGGCWGAFVVTALVGMDALFTAMPVDMIEPMAEMAKPVMTVLALFPLLAVFKQFGWHSGAICGAAILISRLFVVQFTSLPPEAIQMLVGVLVLIICAIRQDRRDRKNGIVPADMSSIHPLYDDRFKQLKANLPLLAITGALIAVVTNAGYLAGSEVSIYSLADAYKLEDATAQYTAITQVAVAEVFRGLGFAPLIVMAALTTGIYGMVGLTFVFVVGYLSPNLAIAAALGAVTIIIEVGLLKKISRMLEAFPSLRNASDNIRDAMNVLMEFALLIGGVLAVMKMGSTTGLTLFAVYYFLNETLGRPVLKIAAPAAATILTGLSLNLFSLLGLFAV
ncbi:YhfT family protein [Enterovibrio sp. ZSDZ35]|uniref:YhfT family protein n=1 Tax=Enterovibrio qingdaonensis TaxID=2899818 RepID=A0ABT5QNV6_9GAMM|nr:YhfT family protein [Enterovibrio sp. ZSDZ35]MDD1782662.1 YhfT family protein [Enterovibrio sp. ZSDZ35]